MAHSSALRLAVAAALLSAAQAFSFAPMTVSRRAALLTRPAVARLGGNRHACIGRAGAVTRGCAPRLGLRMQQQQMEEPMEQLMEEALGGEDAAVFAFSEQKLKSWAQFTGVFVTVFAALFVLWLNPSTGFGDEFAQAFINLGGGDSTVAMVAMLTFFGVAHSGLAGLRRTGEEAINSLLGTEGVGERVWRVFFGVVSLPLAFSTVVFFINHRYDGAQLWDVKLVPGVHEFCWVMSFISFWFLYPSTFNLLEVAAVDKPKVHMWETGIMRVTRHPQLVGQIIWCIPHTLYVGNSFMIWTSLALCAHHSFGAWHGDRRLQDRYGEAFEAVKSRTSVVPFAAIADGRQQLPEKWWTEYLRGPYALITAGTVGAYFAHPLLQGGATLLHW
eukprot:CAMPEP_0180181838 /NCGR_PEP_ID=MMETSP0986-20121125/40335_1 /TAXON_ID=697907 /ORGANISM="non described non described, Strain CCMP2293" /LENGTH=386 /DNA_ID=CAMNT_0022135145 /DNA_START=7 /DNA_END=1167 /DNA_ORIENTATION=+